MNDMDRIDRNILRVLQVEGRLTNAELAERVHVKPRDLPSAHTASV